jgi:hypothetical protein
MHLLLRSPPNSILLLQGKPRNFIVPTNTIISHPRLYTTKLYSNNNDKSLNYACREWLSKPNTFESLLDEVCDIRKPSELVIISDDDDEDANVLDWDTDTRRIALESVIQSLWRVSPDLLDQVLPDGNTASKYNNQQQESRRTLREDLVRIACSRVDFFERNISEYEKTIGMDAIVGSVVDRLIRGSKTVRDPEYQSAWLVKQRQQRLLLIGMAMFAAATIAGIGLSKLSMSFSWPQPPRLTVPFLPKVSWGIPSITNEWGLFSTTRRFWNAVSTFFMSMGSILKDAGRWLWSTLGNVVQVFAGWVTSGVTTTQAGLEPAMHIVADAMMYISSFACRILQIPIDAMTWVGERIGHAITWGWRWVGKIAFGIRAIIPNLGQSGPPPDLQQQQQWMKLNPKYQPPSLRNIAQ